MTHPFLQTRSHMKNIALVQQMELGIEKQTAIRGSRPRKTASRRAGWWFSQMRTVVDKAMDFKPRPTPPTHQPSLALERPMPNW